MIVISIFKKNATPTTSNICPKFSTNPLISGINSSHLYIMKEILKSWVDSPLLLGPSIHSDNGSWSTRKSTHFFNLSSIHLTSFLVGGWTNPFEKYPNNSNRIILLQAIRVFQTRKKSCETTHLRCFFFPRKRWIALHFRHCPRWLQVSQCTGQPLLCSTLEAAGRGLKAPAWPGGVSSISFSSVYGSEILKQPPLFGWC